ncbi:MAG: HAD-IA family hydrolase, partial [Spirochaetia bacterium]|nr:HAD-IA family hydrolase [Spirochaetia bacterium]
KEGIEKPEPGIFLRAVKKAGVKKGEFLYVGDNYLADINGARRAGVIPVWLTRRTEHAQFSFKDAAKNDGVARIKALKELVPLMKKEGWI